MTTRAVNLYIEPFDLYIGRDYRDPLGRGKWGNYFTVEEYGLEGAFKKHREWIVMQPELCKLAPIELKDKRLGCYCKPEPCHGDTLAELADNNGRLVNPA